VSEVDEGLRVRWRDKSDFMTHGPQLACPVMRTAARLQRNQAARVRPELN
jgi:hypothetical protein